MCFVQNYGDKRDSITIVVKNYETRLAPQEFAGMNFKDRNLGHLQLRVSSLFVVPEAPRAPASANSRIADSDPISVLGVTPHRRNVGLCKHRRRTKLIHCARSMRACCFGLSVQL